ncbi:hypothetical protein BOTBODRAFT_523285 [Botryobasidium botryosum FD-172 SS1]|uniref:Uncharacterized protein n=1 Tax=Botryobasidium botryosum (strain FD-172 SS1) TaxID=930990 RepID=A0A067M4M2_BOTB1|nr:hypothetical protein BOTBODRAFT_523285 [Botryobasidium botryosum FD-172 SS1]
MGIILSCFAYLRTLFLNCSKCFSTTSSISSSDYELQIRPAPGDRSTSEVENLGDAQPSSSNIRPFAQALSSATFGELVSGFTPNPNAPGAALRVAFRVPRLDLASRMLHEIALTVEGAGYHNEKYRILCNRCREVLEAIQAGWDPDAEARLNPVLTRLLGLAFGCDFPTSPSNVGLSFLEGIHGAIKSWASLNEIASLQSTPTIINEIKVKFYDLDAFLEEFGVGFCINRDVPCNFSSILQPAR